MKITPTKELDIISKHLDKAKNTSFICYEPECNKLAINSHILQKNGILSLISRKQHLYKLNHNILTQKVSLTKIGINKAFTFKGFCSTHDNTIFKEIENSELDLSNYKTLLLLNYRAILNERRKKEVSVISCESIAKDTKLQGRIDTRSILGEIPSQKIGIRSLDYYLFQLRQDLTNDTESFFFRVVKTKQLDVCTSSIFTMETYSLIRAKINLGIDVVPLPDAIINILPTNDGTTIIFSCLKSNISLATSYILSLNQDPVKFTSDILIKYVETWVCSPDIYFKIFRPNIDLIGKEFANYPTIKDTNKHTSLNIFKGW